jgi:hypothetical protein
MILILEQDTRPYEDIVFHWKPELFISKWDRKTTWRFCWGMWSVSYYASEGLKDFMEHIADGGAKWCDEDTT